MTESTEVPAAAEAAAVTLPCQWCGRAVPQSGQGRPRGYCAERDCQGEAKRARAARRAAGGISGDVAAAEDLADKLRVYADRIGAGVAAELTPAGVQAAIERAEVSA